MRTVALSSPLFLMLFAACGHGTGTLPERATEEAGRAVAGNILLFDPVQHTCALYVAVRSAAWEKPMAFGNEMDDGAIHWNLCPGGEMVACASAPTPNGDTLRTGIPWPYQPVKKL